MLGKSLNEINQLLYATGFVISGRVGRIPKQRKRRNLHAKPNWQIRIEKQVEKMRGELSLMTEMLKDENNSKRSRKRNGITKKYKIKTREDLKTIMEILKMKIQAKAQRLRRYAKRSKQFNQNRLFNNDRKKFYRSLGNDEISVKNTPSKEEIEQFWRGILGEEKHHDDKAQWITREEAKYAQVESQTWTLITKEEVHDAIRTSSNWKSPGIDGIPNFWLKQLTATHDALAIAFNKAIDNPEDLPEWFTTARTFLIPKNGETDKPKNYRPIACLPTLYKILTSIMSERSYKHILTNNILPEEQKGCARNSYGCKDQLLLNKAIIEDCKKKRKNLNVTWIDYRKAYDSVPHSWILKTMSIYKFNNKMINFIKKSMKTWNTTMHLNSVQGLITTEKISIKQGIFQGDSLSPLLFCLALVPLTSELNASGYGYKMNRNSLPISNLLYMDDLKLYASNDDQQQGEIQIVKQFSDDIKMNFGLDKCAKASFIKGKLSSTGNIELDKATAINELDPDSVYKYLGVDESDGIQHTKMKEKLRKEYFRRVRLILRSELNGKNKIEAINSLAIPTVQYSFGIIDWKYSELKKLDSKTRKTLTMHGILHPKSDVDRLYIARKEGGRGLIEIENAYKVAIVGLNHYLENRNTVSSNMIIMHEKRKAKYSISKIAKNIVEEMTDLNFTPNPNKRTAENAKILKHEIKKDLVKKKTNRWQSKPLHGKYPSLIRNPHVDFQNTNNWLRSDIKGETEGLLIAAQDQALYTRNYQKHIVGKEIDSRCRMCYKESETIDHIISGCEVLAKAEYVDRHNKAAAYLHWNICNDLGIRTSDKWYDHQPDTVTNTETHTVLWDMAVQTDRHISANRPDIIIKDKMNSTCKLIDMTVPCDKNVSSKEIEKKSKYKNLEIEIQRMWKMKTEVIPIVIGALGTIKKGMDNNIRNVSENLNIKSLQKTYLLGTARILRKVLSI